MSLTTLAPVLHSLMPELTCAGLGLLVGAVLVSGPSTPAAGEPRPTVTPEQTETIMAVATAVAEPAETPGPVIPYDPMDLEYLAIAIYREGGGDAVCDACRYRIGDVILNRVADDRFPDSIEGVLTQPGQYGRMAQNGITWPERAELPQEQEAVKRSYRTAYNLLTDTCHSTLYGQGYIFQSTQSGLGSDNGKVHCCGQYFAKGE